LRFLPFCFGLENKKTKTLTFERRRKKEKKLQSPKEEVPHKKMVLCLKTTKKRFWSFIKNDEQI
jgi:hypothetical protein